MFVLGRAGDEESGRVGELGRYRARDGSEGAPVGVDLDRPHVGLVVGKRGYGKSYTVGVLAEAAVDAAGVAPVVVDPMGALTGVAAGGPVDPRVRPTAVPARAWPDLVGLDATGAAGALVWQAAEAADTLAGMCDHVADADAPGAARLAARNHLGLAQQWGVFDADAPPVATLADGGPTVLDCTGLDPAPAGAVVRAVADGLYDARQAGDLDRLPWLFVDEAHAFFEGVAAPALRRLLTRGRAPGVSLVAATQRPGALPEVARSQADLVVAHRLTAAEDVAALVSAAPDALADQLRDRVPTAVGEAAVVDDVTESVHAVSVRERRTPHRGGSPRASRLDAGGEVDERGTGQGPEPDGDGRARSETAE